MTNDELEIALERSVNVERESTLDVLRLLRELEARGLHWERGYSSLFDYCRRKLGYSEPEANLRIQAMRLMRAVPEVEAHLERGELSMTVAVQIQRAAQREELPAAETKQLVADLAGSSKRETDRKLAELFPEAPLPEKVRPIAGNLVEIRFTVTAEEAALIQELMNKRAHSNFERRYDKLVMDLVRKELKEPRKAAAPQRPDVVNRHIPSSTRRAVWKRDGGRCQYKDPLTQNRCECRHGLQLDHIQPYAQGGSHEPENLRLLCGAHNRWRNFSAPSGSAPMQRRTQRGSHRESYPGPPHRDPLPAAASRARS